MWGKKRFEYSTISTRSEWFTEHLRREESEGWVICGEPSVYRMDLRDYLKAAIKRRIKNA